MENIKNSKVTQVSGNGVWESAQYGKFYKFEVVFENGDSGQYMSKEENQTKFKVGMNADYTITSKDVNGKLYYTIKAAQAQKQGGWSKPQADPEKEARISRMSVLKVATDIYLENDTMQIWDIIPLAQSFEHWVMTGENKLTEPAKQPTKAQPKAKSGIIDNFREESIRHMENDNDLPF
jgi:hypothetical protein